MKEVILKFVGVGYYNYNQANILIYDSYNNLICEKNTYNGRLKVCLKANAIYKIKAKTIYGEVNTSFYVNNNLNTYVFAFNYSHTRTCKKLISITFTLTDAYYDNLPIKKGEIYLWQR